MKKICRNFCPAFSLAEALITLLIICIIVLASVPVITKKRRDMTEGPKGMWICTRNSQGQYVYYDNRSPKGDINNIDSWTATGTDSCTFTSGSRPYKYGITVIGGGGGGGNGSSYREILARQTSAGSTSFSPEKTDLYDVLLIGGGGGGGGGQSSDDNTGGGGGGGGRFEGFIPLYRGTAYTMTVGGGGTTRGGEYHGGLSNSVSHPRADDGGSSYLTRSGGGDSKTYIEVAGGQGGDSVGCSKWKCRGGDAGYGRGVVSANYYSSLEVNGNTVSAFSGHVTGSNGQWGDYYKRYNPYGRGAKNYYTDTADNVTTYGDGGDPGACRSCIWAKNGVNGYGVISKTWKKFGMGGTSAIPQTYFVPSLEGKLVVTIPDAAGPEEKGGTTVAKNVKNNVVGRIFYGYGAAGGKADESLEAPSAGEHSQFSLKGGGAPAPECTPRSYIPGGYAPVTVAVKKCTKVVCNIVEANEDKIKEENVMSTGVEVLPQGFVKVGSKYALKQSVDDNKPEDITPFVVSTSTPSSQSLSDYFQSIKLYEYIKGRYTTIMNNLIRWIKISGCFPEYNEGDEDKTEFAGYDNKDTVYNTYRCFRDSNIKYEKICAEDVVETKETQGWHAGMIQPAICKENASPGTSYGAGGGGGNASDTPGVLSKELTGGYGAVIVEW